MVEVPQPPVEGKSLSAEGAKLLLDFISQDEYTQALINSGAREEVVLNNLVYAVRDALSLYMSMRFEDYPSD